MNEVKLFFSVELLLLLLSGCCEKRNRVKKKEKF